MNRRWSTASRLRSAAAAPDRGKSPRPFPRNATAVSRLLLVVLVAAMATVLSLSTGCPSPAPAGKGLERIRAAGVLRWGGDTQGGEPYVYDDPAKPGHLIGFEVDLAAAIARELGVRSEFVQNDWSNLVPSLERGTFDIVMNGLEVTDARTGRVLFTRPYYVFAERLMVRATDAPAFHAAASAAGAAGDPASLLASLKGHKVGTLSNSLAFEMLRASSDTVIYEGVEEPYTDLQRGRTDAVLLDDIIATRYGAPKPDLAVLGDLRDGYYSIAVRPAEPEVKAAIDEALGRIAASGELHRILDGSRIWNARQERLTTWSAADQAQMLGQPPPPAVFGRAHVVLFVKGAAVTLFVSVLAMALAIPLGLLLSLVRMYGGGFARFFAGAYVEIYRGTPVLLQLYLLYYGLAPVLKLGALTAAIIGLGMNYAAYEAEVYRAGMQAVPKTQMEAALSLGMTRSLALRRVVLPQAIRHAIPNVTNDFIALLKDSSLVSVITVVELTKQMTISAVDVRTWVGPGLTCAALYFAMSYPLGILARRLEKKLEGERNEEDAADAPVSEAAA